MPSIKLNGQKIEYSVRESNRAKRISMRVDLNKGLELVYPEGISEPAPEEVLAQNEEWVLETLEKLENRLETQFQRQYIQDEIFRYLGNDYALNFIQKKNGKRITIKFSDDNNTLNVALPPDIETSDTEAIQEAVEKFYRKKAKDYLPDRAREIADELGHEIKRVYVKNQKTRWGSCSSKNNINLNLRLMMTPKEAIDYIIIHELCHMTHMDHSKAFWDLVETHCPRYKYWRKWFKQNSQYLVL